MIKWIIVGDVQYLDYCGCEHCKGHEEFGTNIQHEEFAENESDAIEQTLEYYQIYFDSEIELVSGYKIYKNELPMDIQMHNLGAKKLFDLGGI